MNRLFQEQWSYTGDKIGVVTAGGVSPYLGHAIGYALFDSPEYGPGATVNVGCRDGSMQNAELVELPFYDKNAEIPRGKRIDIPDASSVTQNLVKELSRWQKLLQLED